jgi:pimeloyl-ACP methyl ester carboxylesterase
MMKKTIRYRDALLTYHIYGEGFPVVLIHGFGETNAIWKNQTGYLSEKCKLIVPDLPGSGESALPRLEEKLSINELEMPFIQSLKMKTSKNA